jgi:hypothetical protein
VNGISTLYAHLKNFKKDEQGASYTVTGQLVKKNEVIGEMGNTGLSTEPHLHFEVRKKDIPVDPLPYIDGTKKIQDFENILVNSDETGFISSSNLQYDFVSDELYSSNFNTTGEITKFNQPPGNAWGISKEGDINTLSCIGFSNGETFIAKNFNVTDTAIISITYKVNLTSGEYFKLLFGDKEIFSVSSSTDGYVNYLIESSIQGANTLFLKFEKNLGTDSYVRVSDIKVINKYKKIKNENGKINTPDSITINNNIPTGSYIKQSPDEYSTNLHEVNPNEQYSFIETTYNDSEKWYKTIHGGVEGYISSNISFLTGHELYVETHQVPTGNFIYSKTLTLDNVISMELDYKYEMRASTATFTIENINNMYSPDYSPAKFNEFGLDFSEFKGVFVENAPVRIYIGYGEHLQRKFTGLVSNISVNGEDSTLTVNCIDMMKKINDYFNYIPVSYPSNGEYETAWLASSVIHDMVITTGMNDWRTVKEDLHLPSIVIEDSYYTELRPSSGTFVKIDEKNEFNILEISSLPDTGGYKNPAIWTGHISVGTNYGEYIENICNQLGYWHRCNYYGTYYATKIPYLTNNKDNIEGLSVFKFIDGDNLVSVNKSHDYSKIRNHLMISGPFKQDHFFDIDLWRLTNGTRKTASEYFDFANTYGIRREIAKKIFYDIKCITNTLQVAVEGNPYIELMDIIEIENKNTNTKDCYLVKGIKDVYTEEQGYITSMDLFWL